MTGPDNIKEVIKQMLDKLIDEYSPCKVILFGSYAHGNPSPDSDIDLLIVKETTDRFLDRWTTVQRLLTGMHQRLPVETLVMTPEEVEARLAAGDHFIEDILSRGEVLYAAS